MEKQFDQSRQNPSQRIESSKKLQILRQKFQVSRVPQISPQNSTQERRLYRLQHLQQNYGIQIIFEGSSQTLQIASMSKMSRETCRKEVSSRTLHSVSLERKSIRLQDLSGWIY